MCYRLVCPLIFKISLSFVVTRFIMRFLSSGTEAMFADLGYYGQAPVRVCIENNYEFDF